MSRPSIQDTMFVIAEALAKRSTCPRGQVGAVITDTTGRILTTGYNGSPPKAKHCSEYEHGCVTIEGRCASAVHAEANAVAHAAQRGISLVGSIAYVTAHPCHACAKLLVTAGVFRVYYAKPYGGQEIDAITEMVAPMEYIKWTF